MSGFGTGETKYSIELIFLPIYGISGLVKAYVYEKSGCIYTSMIIHFIGNTLGFLTILFI